MPGAQEVSGPIGPERQVQEELPGPSWIQHLQSKERLQQGPGLLGLGQLLSSS